MSKYFRITGYCPAHDCCFIMDSNGMFNEIWEFSAYIISKGCKILEVGSDEKFKDINISKADEDNQHVLLRACSEGKPTISNTTINGIYHKTVEVKDKRYIPE